MSLDLAIDTDTDMDFEIDLDVDMFLNMDREPANITSTDNTRGVKTKEKCSNTAGSPLNLCYYIFHYGKYQKFGNPDYKPDRGLGRFGGK